MSRQSFYRFKSPYVLALVLALSAGPFIAGNVVSADETTPVVVTNTNSVNSSTDKNASLSETVSKTVSASDGDQAAKAVEATGSDETKQASSVLSQADIATKDAVSVSLEVADSVATKLEPNLALGADASQNQSSTIPEKITLEDYRRASATQMSQWVKAGRVSGEQLLDFAVESIKATNPELNNIISVREAAAREELSHLVDKGQPFYKVPIVVKGLGHTIAGGQNTQGLSFLSAQTSRTTGFFVKQLQKLGFIVIGQSSFPQLGLINVTNSDLYGVTHNPWNLAYNPGGSSGGSAAAVASGQVPIASASDGGGSTRIPASWSGLVGLHPTRGILEGNAASAKNQVSHFAVTKTVEDTQALFQVLLKEKARAAQTKAVLSTDQVIAYTTKTPAGTPISPEAVKAVHEAVDFLNKQGFKTVEVGYPIDGKRMMMDYYTIAAGSTAIADYLITQKLKRHLTKDDVELLTWALYQTSQSLTREDVNAAWDDVAKLTNNLNAFYEKYPILLTPTTAYPAPVADYHHIPDALKSQMEDMSSLSKEERLQLIYDQWLPAWTLTPFTQLANLTGTPSLTLPTHLTKDGLPMGVLFNAQANQDSLLLQIGDLFEKSSALTTMTTQKVFDKTVVLPFSTRFVKTNQLLLGEIKHLQVGHEGQKRMFYRLVNQGLSLIEATLISQELLSQPQDNIYLVGTRKPKETSSSTKSIQAVSVEKSRGQQNIHAEPLTGTHPSERASSLSNETLPVTGETASIWQVISLGLGLSSLVIGLSSLRKNYFKR